MLPFTKVEGLGNDFVVVDLRGERASSKAAAAVQDPETVRRVCDRHFGVGADGVLAILPGQQGDARMRVLNADGSEAEMCGNGIRCVAKLLYETDPALRKPVLTIDTGAGLLACEMNARDGRVESVTVEMGRPRFTRDEIPLAPGGEARVLREPIEADGRIFRFTAVSMGNPHAVIAVHSVDRAPVGVLGPKLERHPSFPRGVNVGFMQRESDRRIRLRVFERGAGETLACGTGAAAAVAVGRLWGELADEVDVSLPGGVLKVIWHGPGSALWQTGAVSAVYEGRIEL